jgi:hypothetical protein
MRKIITKLTALVIFLLFVNTSFAQQWCSQEFKPLHSYDVRDSPDYGKVFSFYVFDQAKTIGSKDIYFTHIFKVSFNYYGRGTSSFKIFEDHIFENFNKYLEENVDEDWSLMRGSQTYGRTSRMRTCMNYEDLQKRLVLEKDKAKNRGWNVKVMERFTPVNQEIQEGPRRAPSQNVSFNIVR